jgi:ribonuclease inhibitor
MHTIMLDGNRYHSVAEVYHAIAVMLSFPDYFGNNADALNDCLSERKHPASLWILSSGRDEVARCIALIARVFEDNGGTVKEI